MSKQIYHLIIVLSASSSMSQAVLQREPTRTPGILSKIVKKSQTTKQNKITHKLGIPKSKEPSKLDILAQVAAQAKKLFIKERELCIEKQRRFDQRQPIVSQKPRPQLLGFIPVLQPPIIPWQLLLFPQLSSVPLENLITKSPYQARESLALIIRGQEKQPQ